MTIYTYTYRYVSHSHGLITGLVRDRHCAVPPLRGSAPRTSSVYYSYMSMYKNEVVYVCGICIHVMVYIYIHVMVYIYMSPGATFDVGNSIFSHITS